MGPDAGDKAGDDPEGSPGNALKWAKRGCPQNPDGTFCLADVVNWRISETELNVDGADRREESLGRWRTAKAGIAEIELARLDGSVIPTDVARRAIGRLLGDARTIWQGLPVTLSMMIADPDLKAGPRQLLR